METQPDTTATSTPTSRPNPPHDPPGGDLPETGPRAPRPHWADLFQRRLRLALGDLRLPLPTDWLVVGDDGTVTFKNLDRLPADRLVLALEAGGVRCRACGGGRPISDEALAVSRAVLGGGLVAVLDLPDGDVAREVDTLATSALEGHLERRLRSVRVLHGA
jgi:hypothetical protein